MPATESTKYNLNTMHAIFGVSSLILLGTTIWMFVADHDREWKNYQLTSQKVDTYYNTMRINEQSSDEYKATTKKLEAQIDIARVLGWFSANQTPDAILGVVKTAEEKKLVNLQLKTGLISRTNEIEKSLQEYIKTATESQSALITKLGVDPSKTSEIESALAKVFLDTSKQEERTLLTKFLADRKIFVNAVEDLIAQIAFKESQLSSEVKNQTAFQGKAAADRDQLINKNAGHGTEDELKAAAEREAKAQEKFLEETARLQGGGLPGLKQQLEEAKTIRESLQSALAKFAEGESAAKKSLADHNNQLKQLVNAMEERAISVTKVITSAPIIDAFGGYYKPEQIWLPDLPQPNGSFGSIARFDRCTTCHQGIAKTATGSAVDPAYPEQNKIPFSFSVDLAKLTKEARAEILKTREESTDLVTTNKLLMQIYGFTIAEQGLFSPNDATISMVAPNTPAAAAGLSMGDVIDSISGTKIDLRKRVETILLDNPDWDNAPKLDINLIVRRGVPQPYCSHPRMDLFIGSMSPHPIEKFGCTICHQGQGSATEFKWVSHSPNTLLQEEQWSKEHGYFDNHHWIYPMMPERFIESSCLKCHHDVVELKPSEKFPDAPAPKLVQGYTTIREYGCFGCHEINGYDGPKKRVGPDLRVEPSFYAAADQLLADPGLKDLAANAVALAKQVSVHPEDDAARRELQVLVATDALAAERAKPNEKTYKLKRDSHRLASVLKDVETPGEIRKVGPSLRYVADKVGYQFLYDWIRNPTDFRPSTKMPRFFGLFDHLEGKSKEIAEVYEDLEIRGMTEYLLAASQKYEPVTAPQGVDAASLERGKQVFSTRGCLACHAHDDFPQSTSHQGPNLSRMAEKLSLDDPKKGAAWLYSWVREPNRYHSRTVMPNLYLDPYPVYKMQDGKEVRGADGKPEVEKMVDPAADVVAYLMTVKDSEHAYKPNVPARADASVSSPQVLKEFRDPKNGYDVKKLTDLERLAYEHLLGKFNDKSRAAAALETGIPADLARGDDQELVGVTADTRAAQLLKYVGRRSISKYGCFGCHDIPGYEDAKPIGAALSDWGRKDPAKLAFENIGAYVHDKLMHHGSHGAGHGHGHDAAAHEDEAKPAAKDPISSLNVAADRLESELETSSNFLQAKLLRAQRDGFLWNKLHRPRSYDYKKTETKNYNDKYRMPKFNFAHSKAKQDEAVEAVMTFVLGLVAEPPPASYVYQPNPRQKAILAGKKLLEKYNCGGCHMLEMERWELTFKPDDERLIINSSEDGFYPFQKIHAATETVAGSLKTDRAGNQKASLIGLPKIDLQTGGTAVYEVEETGTQLTAEDLADVKPGTEFDYQFFLYEPTVINGKVVPVTAQPLVIRSSLLSKKTAAGGIKVWPAQGGDLVRYIYPQVFAAATTKPQAGKEETVLGWLPPTLHGEGRKVQTQWLHDFLLNPHPIRPAAVLRMPKFNMTSHEAQQFAEYFAAKDNVPYPYEASPVKTESYLAAAAQANPQRMESALKVVTSRKGLACIQCHYIGDFDPGGDPSARGPQLARVHERLRPDYLRNWIANPNNILPYTGMPAVIPFEKPVEAAPFPGADPAAQSIGQLQAVVDYFMNFDKILKQEYKFSTLVPPPADAAAPPADNKGAESKPASE